MRRYARWAFIFTSTCPVVARFLHSARLTSRAFSHSTYSRHFGPWPRDGAQHYGVHDGDSELHHLLRDVQDIHISLSWCVLSFHASVRLSFWHQIPAEKVYAVWATGPVKGRLRCKVYLACLALVSCYVGVAILMIMGAYPPLPAVEAFIHPPVIPTWTRTHCCFRRPRDMLYWPEACLFGLTSKL